MGRARERFDQPRVLSSRVGDLELVAPRARLIDWNLAVDLLAGYDWRWKRSISHVRHNVGEST